MTTPPTDVASQIARSLAELLAAQKSTVVLAESCTGGMVSAKLAEIPGISSWLCGSAVVYQEATKEGWIGVRAETLSKYGAVSEPTAREMVAGVLQITPHAALAASITGHLGPGAPEDQDGQIFVGVGWRDDEFDEISVVEDRLKSIKRVDRQVEATSIVLRDLMNALKTAK